MPSLADLQRQLDAEIFDAIGELLVLPGGARVGGVFFNRPREVAITEIELLGIDLSFDCQINAGVAALERGQAVSVIGVDETGAERALGSYRFARRVPETGTESGLVTLELTA